MLRTSNQQQLHSSPVAGKTELSQRPRARKQSGAKPWVPWRRCLRSILRKRPKGCYDRDVPATYRVALPCALLAGLAFTGCQNSTTSSPDPLQDSAWEKIQPNDTAIPSANSTAESDWQSQFAAVRAGSDDTLLIAGQAITAEQLGRLPELDGALTQLLIDAGGVDEDHLPDITAVKSLVHLRLRECPIGDRGFEQLATSGLDALRILNVPQTRVTSQGIASLASLPSLVQLRLGGSQLDDNCVKEIAKLPKLRSLHLIGPSLTDAALAQLAHAPSLTSFYLDDCPLSDSAWEQLFTAKPNLHVHIDQQHHDRDPHRH